MYHKKLDQSKISKIKKENGIDQFIQQNNKAVFEKEVLHDQNIDNETVYEVIDQVKQIVVSNLFVVRNLAYSDGNILKSKENVSQIYHSFSTSESILESLLEQIHALENEANENFCGQLDHLKQMIVEAQEFIQHINIKKIDLFQKTIKDIIQFVDKIYKELSKSVINTKNFIALNIAQETMNSIKKNNEQKTTLLSTKGISKVLNLEETPRLSVGLVESV